MGGIIFLKKLNQFIFLMTNVFSPDSPDTSKRVDNMNILRGKYEQSTIKISNINSVILFIIFVLIASIINDIKERPKPKKNTM